MAHILKNKKILFAFAGIILCAMISFAPVPEQLETAALSVGSTGHTAMCILGITALAILWWVGNVCADWMTTIVMMILWVILGNLSFTSAFASFSGSTVWMIVGAFCLASAITKTGLFTRIYWFLIRIFSPTYKGQMLALMIVGAICSPLIPSLTAKAVLGVTIANGIADAMGYGKNSNGRYGLCLAAWCGFGSTAPAFVSGSIFGYTLLVALPEGITVTWGSWAIAMIPWLIVLLVGSFFALQIIYKPEKESEITREYAARKYRELGNLQGKELLSAFILTGAVALWILESALKIDAAATALLAAALCFILRILDRKEIATAPNWGFVIFLGGVLNLGIIFTSVGIDKWLQLFLAPVFETMSSPFLAAALLFIIVILIRFILVSESATIIIMMAVLSPIAYHIGLSPFIIGIVTYVAAGIWFVPYQSATFVTAFICTNGTLEYKGTLKACIVFIIISFIGCMVSIPYWSFMQYI